MARARVNVVMDRTYIPQLLKSEGVAGAVEEAANTIASTAGAGYTVQVDRSRRKSRIIAMVMDLGRRAMSREAGTGNLARAVSANTESWQRR